jgi:hypothetical protein
MLAKDVEIGGRYRTPNRLCTAGYKVVKKLKTVCWVTVWGEDKVYKNVKYSLLKPY